LVPHAPASPLKLAALFFINAAAMGMWIVPFGNVLRAHGYEDIIGYAYACSGIAAFISPLAVGALADQHVPPARLVRWLAVLTSMFLALAFAAIERHWAPLIVLGFVQMQAICAAPIFGLSTSIVLSSLRNPGREFAPLRSTATLGWMAAGWVVSFVLNGDTSTMSGYGAAATWLCTAAFTFVLPETPPLEHKEPRDMFGLAALQLFTNKDHRVVFLAAALFNIPMAAFYPYTPIHLTKLGVDHATAAMTLGQVSEVISMFGLAGLLTRWRLKWVFLAGIGFGVMRFALCALDSRAWVLAGISLHGFAFTLYFITAQIYLEQRVDPRIRARAQALLGVMVSGFGNLFGYLGSGAWRRACTAAGETDWPTFWTGTSVATAAVFVWFALSYRGRGPQQLG
jgi:nucleoside transporter